MPEELFFSVNDGGDFRVGNAPPEFPQAVKIIAQVISYIFHPVFVVCIMTIYLVYWNPRLFIGSDGHERFMVMARVLYVDVFFPLFTVLLLKALKFIPSIELKTQRDRIIPYVATLTFYFWAYMVSRNLAINPPEMTAMLFGAFLSVSGALVLNSFFKISMHAIGVGGLLMLMLIMLFRGTPDLGLFLILSVLIAGLVCTSRMIVSDHTNQELALGFVLGMLAQVIAFLIIE